MTGRRCAFGCATWPDTPDYRVCPACEQRTKRVRSRSLRPLPIPEAERLANAYRFERFYEEWDAERDPARLEPGPAEDVLALGLARPHDRPLLLEAGA